MGAVIVTQMTNENISIAVTCNDSYSQHLSVLLCSIFSNKKSSTVIDTVYVFSNGISEDNRNKLSKITADNHSAVKYIQVDEGTYHNLSLTRYLSHHSVYYRISIPDLLDKSLEKILYLDCDTIVLKDLEDLWKSDIGDHYVAAVLDPLAESKQKAYIAEKNTYFNDGVMLMNLKKWRADNLSEKIFEFLRKNKEKLLYCDQDGVNAVINGKFLRLKPKFNSMSYFDDTLKIDMDYPDEEIKESLTSPVIVHFTEGKPWNLDSKHRYKYHYYLYLFKTPWRFSILKSINTKLKSVKYKDIKYRFLGKHPKLFESLRKIKRII